MLCIVECLLYTAINTSLSLDKPHVSVIATCLLTSTIGVMSVGTGQISQSLLVPFGLGKQVYCSSYFQHACTLNSKHRTLGGL